jgi:hypothetical protein
MPRMSVQEYQNKVLAEIIDLLHEPHSWIEFDSMRLCTNKDVDGECELYDVDSYGGWIGPVYYGGLLECLRLMRTPHEEWPECKKVSKAYRQQHWDFVTDKAIGA